MFPSRLKLIVLFLILISGWMINDLANNRETDPTIILLIFAISVTLLLGQGRFISLFRGG